MRSAGDEADLARVRSAIGFQARACAASASPLYEQILEVVDEDLRQGGVCTAILCGRGEDPLTSALALRLLAAVHRIVLDGRAPELARCYPSMGGSATTDAGPTFLRTVQHHRAEVATRTGDGVQTNEVGRAAMLVGGFAEVARRTQLPLRVLEVGASAGLNLRWDHFAYVTARGVAGDPGSPVRFERDVWAGSAPDLPPRFTVVERAGCDRNPLDPTSAEDRQALRSFVWPDHLGRLAQLDGAIEVARRVPATVDRAEADRWVAARLAAPVAGAATVVVHSIVLPYLATDARHRLRDALLDAGRRASPEAPLAWLRMEPAGDRADLRLTTWPDGEEQVLAESGYHGQPVWWAGAT